MSPTYDRAHSFNRDYDSLSAHDRDLFAAAVIKFLHDLRAGHFRKGLRIKRVRGTADVFEMTFASDGRATWQFGEEVIAGEPHIIWRRIGTHKIFDRP